MKNKDVLDQSLVLIPRWYAFAYILMPDELMAEQLINDALTFSLLKEKEEWQELIVTSDSTINKHALFKILLPAIFNLARKRNVQTKLKKETSGFYSLDLVSRTVLYARFKLGFDYAQIQTLFGISFAQVTQASLLGYSALKELPPEFRTHV